MRKQGIPPKSLHSAKFTGCFQWERCIISSIKPNCDESRMTYRKVTSGSLSQLVAHFQIFKRLMKSLYNNIKTELRVVWSPINCNLLQIVIQTLKIYLLQSKDSIMLYFCLFPTFSISIQLPPISNLVMTSIPNPLACVFLLFLL